MPAGRGNVPKNNTLPGPNRGSSGSPGSPAGPRANMGVQNSNPPGGRGGPNPNMMPGNPGGPGGRGGPNPNMLGRGNMQGNPANQPRGGWGPPPRGGPIPAGRALNLSHNNPLPTPPPPGPDDYEEFDYTIDNDYDHSNNDSQTSQPDSLDTQGLAAQNPEPFQVELQGDNPYLHAPATFEFTDSTPEPAGPVDPSTINLGGLFEEVAAEPFFAAADPLATMLPPGRSNETETEAETSPSVPEEKEVLNDFYEAETEANIQYDGDSLKGGSFTQLIAKLTTMPSPIDMDDFLLTYRSYSNPAQLLDCLIQRFNTAHVSDKKVVHLRTFTVLGKWISDYWYDFETDDYCLQTTIVFLANSMKSEDKMVAKVSLDVNNKLDRKVKQLTSNLIAHQQDCPPPLLGGVKDINQTALLDHSEMELARQITLKTWDMWGHIKPWELLDLAWTKKDKETKAKNVLEMTTFFNYLSGWVTTTVITTKNPKFRVLFFKKFIKLAQCLRQLGNFNGLMAVWSGLQRQPVFRLAKTAAAAFHDKDIAQIHAELSQITRHDKSYAEMRRIIQHETNPPVIPYLGMYLTDLVFIEEGNPKKVAGTSLINYGKCRLVAGAVKKIQNYQQMGYNFKRLPQIQIRLANLTVIQDEKDMDDISKHNEPREGQQPGPEPKSIQEFREKCNEARQRMLSQQAALQPKPGTNSRGGKPSVERLGVVPPSAGGRGRGVNPNVPAPPPGGSEALAQRTERSNTTEVEIKLDATEATYPFSPIVPDTIVNFHSQGNTIIYATLAKLIDHLTQPPLDTRVLNAVTSKACSAIKYDEFLQTVILRYTVPPPVDPSVHATWLVKHRNPISTRVFNLLKHWLKQSWHVFEADPSLKETLINFSNTMLPSPETTRLQELIKAAKPLPPSPFFNLKPPTMMSNTPGAKTALSYDDSDIVSSLTLDALHSVYSKITEEMLLTPKTDQNFLDGLDWGSIVKQIQDPKAGFPCKERRKLMTKYPRTVLGSEVTEWFCGKPFSLSKPHSILAGKHLQKIGIIVSLDKTTEFEANDIFQFCPQEAIPEILLNQNVKKSFDFDPSPSDSALESLVKSHLLSLKNFVFNELQSVSSNIRDVTALTKRWVSIAMSLEEQDTQNFHSQMGVVAGLLQAYRKTQDNKALLDKIWDRETTAWLRNRRNFFSSEVSVLRDHFSRTMCAPAIPMFHIFYNWARANSAHGEQKMSPTLINIKRISADFGILELFERAHATPFEISPNFQILAYLGSSFTG